MARATVDDSKLAVEQARFAIDAFDEKSIILIPDADAAYDAAQHALFTGMAEVKWRRMSTHIAGWVVPATKVTLDYINATWRKSEYTISETANILLMYEDLAAKVDSAKAARRWDYLFNDKPSDFIYPYTRKPFMHQAVAVEAAYGAEYFGHLMEMGTGKTKCVCDEASIYISKLMANEMFKCVIVCPKSLMINWEREIKANINIDLFNITVVQLKGEIKSIDSLMAAFREPTRVKFFIVSYDSCASMLDALQMLKPTMLVCDESHYIKNSDSKRWKAVRKLAESCTMKRILTGTPISNTLLDVWSQFEILRPGAIGYNTFAGFKKAYCNIEMAGAFEKITGYHDVDKLKQNMARMSFLVRKEQCLDLPDQLYDVRRIEMPDAMKKTYNEFATSFYTMLENGMEVSTEHMIVQMLRLSQICCGFTGAQERYLDSSGAGQAQYNIDGDIIGESEAEEKYRSVLTPIPGGDTKMDEMLEDAAELIKEGSKLIIWSRFRYDNQRLHRKLNDLGIWNGIYDGGTSERDKQDIVDAFNKDDKFKVIIGNTGSGGVGLTLLGTKTCPCHTSFFYSNDFSYGKRQQAEARNHRIGQVNKVLYRDYIYAGSIEEYIVSKLNQKKNLSDAVKDIGELKDFLLKGMQ